MGTKGLFFRQRLAPAETFIAMTPVVPLMPLAPSIWLSSSGDYRLRLAWPQATHSLGSWEARAAVN
jgi:hypothetical protein